VTGERRPRGRLAPLPAVRRRIAGEGGYTLSEMLVVLAILGVVLAGLAGVFTSALRAEVDMNQRFQAQQNGRLALSKLRRELHCARQTFVQADGSAATIVSAVSANTAYCRSGQSTWCALPIAGAAGRYALYRQAGATCDASGVRMADYLTTSAVFQLVTAVAGSRGRVAVNLSVDLDSQDPARRYRLYDEITMRGSVRA
jgi:prepilin-type N-terminal cleavage/methylation domain-containing protein